MYFTGDEKLLAKYEGLHFRTPIFEQKTFAPGYYNDKGIHISHSKLNYGGSWDCLMRIIGKLLVQGAVVEHSYDQQSIYYCSISDNESMTICSGDTPLKAAYRTCVLHIKESHNE